MDDGKPDLSPLPGQPTEADVLAFADAVAALPWSRAADHADGLRRRLAENGVESAAWACARVAEWYAEARAVWAAQKARQARPKRRTRRGAYDHPALHGEGAEGSSGFNDW